jgi:putative transposase
MAFKSDHHQRRSIRLQNYDYTATGAYFITICVHNRECLFGDVACGEMLLNPIGQLVAQEWCNTATRRAGMQLDAWVVMPNHFHGILIIEHDGAVDNGRTGMARHAPTMDRAPTNNIARKMDRAPINDIARTGMACHAPTRDAPIREFGKPVAGSLSAIIGAFKSASTRLVNRHRQAAGTPLWQRNYWERVIRNDEELQEIRRYIHGNPTNWQNDTLYGK